jgi:hypothetical protein
MTLRWLCGAMDGWHAILFREIIDVSTKAAQCLNGADSIISSREP